MCSLFIQKKVTLCHLLVYQGPMFIPLLLLQSAGVWGFRSFWVSRPSNRGLETCEVVQSSVCPADPGGDAAVNHQRANPTTSPTDHFRPRAVCRIDCYPRPICLRGHACPEVAQKAPRSKAGKAQLAAASQKRGRGGGSKGIRLEDSSVSAGAKWKKRSNQPDSSDNRRPQYEDTFEDSDDSTESFDGPFPGPPSSAVASSTTGTTSQTSK